MELGSIIIAGLQALTEGRIDHRPAEGAPHQGRLGAR